MRNPRKTFEERSNPEGVTQRVFQHRRNNCVAPSGAILRSRGDTVARPSRCLAGCGGNVKIRRYGLGDMPDRDLACAGLKCLMTGVALARD